MPSTVCEDCVAEICRCFYFRRQCIDSDGTLKSMLGIEHEEKHEFIIKDPEASEEQDSNVIYSVKNESNDEDDENIIDNDTDVKHEYVENSLSGDINEHYKVTETIEEYSENQVTDEAGEVVKKNVQKITNEALDCAYNDFIKNLDIDEEHEEMFYELYNSNDENSLIVGSSNMFKCNICFEVFATAEEHMSHIDSHDANAKYVCNICDREFSRKHDLVKHFKYHDPRIINHCFYCGKRMPDIDALKNHLKNHEFEDTNSKFSCYFCEKKYRNIRLCQVIEFI